MIHNLASLMNTLQQATPENNLGLPVAKGQIDFSSLPTFGGEEPASTEWVLSWDSTHVLIGCCIADMEILSREEWFNIGGK